MKTIFEFFRPKKQESIDNFIRIEYGERRYNNEYGYLLSEVTERYKSQTQ